MVTKTAPVDGTATSIFTIFPTGTSPPTVVIGTPSLNQLGQLSPPLNSNTPTGTPVILGGASSSSEIDPLVTSSPEGDIVSILTLFQTSGSLPFTSLTWTMVSHLVSTTIVIVNVPTGLVETDELSTTLPAIATPSPLLSTVSLTSVSLRPASVPSASLPSISLSALSAPTGLLPSSALPSPIYPHHFSTKFVSTNSISTNSITTNALSTKSLSAESLSADTLTINTFSTNIVSS
ncbi:hypothetical protein BFW01_g8235 [Lasiodiplodia theobromae]|nr:hypothetical protein BFW01_g8235 [Lasiodiplodia theobromae]